MTRHEELNGIDYYIVNQISDMLKISRQKVVSIIEQIELVSFEKRYYSIEQIELIKNYR
jgi:biotin operon repressor